MEIIDSNEYVFWRWIYIQKLKSNKRYDLDTSSIQSNISFAPMFFIRTSFHSNGFQYFIHFLVHLFPIFQNYIIMNFYH